MTQNYYDSITGLLCSSFHSSVLLEAIELRSLCFSKLDFRQMAKALQFQTRMSMICLYHVDIGVDQLKDIINSCPNLTQVVIDSSYIRSSSSSKKNNSISSTFTRCIPSSKFPLYSRRSTITTVSTSQDSSPSSLTTHILFPNLKYLELSGCTIIDQTANIIEENIIRGCCCLEHLVVTRCEGPVSLVSIFDTAIKTSKKLKSFTAQCLPTR
ncbi:hypothetical protein K492DRAFT_86926 [Lichtheimia hyalospora FSU 10163]|nr:hypothetical protein K492DRAFT_86926 [Lichtheimia hyalospora FSU 10163]